MVVVVDGAAAEGFAPPSALTPTVVGRPFTATPLTFVVLAAAQVHALVS